MKLLKNWMLMFMITTMLFSTSIITQAQNKQFNLSNESKIEISGTSTLHDWEAEAKTSRGTIVAKENGANPHISKLDISNVMLIIPSKQILSDNNGMNRRIHDALNADDHAHIIFRLQNVSYMDDATGNKPNIIATGTLNIAGETQTVKVSLIGQVLKNGNLRFTGNHKLKMSDYNIERPTAMMGTVRAGDEINVNFNLLFTKE